MSLTIHQTGIDAAINAQASGFDGVTLNRADLYNNSRKIKSVTLKGVQVIEPSRIYVVAQDSSTDSYDVTKIRFYTSSNALFATAQNADNTVIQSKAANSTLLLAHQLNLSTAPGTVAPSGDVTVYAPQATESLLGTAEIATQSETDAGTDDTRFITAKKLLQWLKHRLSSSTTSTSTTTPANSAAVRSATLAGTRQATETRRGQAEIATQAEVNVGTDNTRFVTPKKLWGLLNAKFARTDIRPLFKAGIDTNGKSVKFGGDSGQFEGIKYDDSSDQPGTFHFVADGKADESDSGNAFLQFGGFTLGNGQKVTRISNSHNDPSTVALATTKAVKTAMEAGTRQATETRRGQAEIATQAEVNAGSDNTRFVTPKKLKKWGQQQGLRIVGELAFFSFDTIPAGFFALDNSTIPNGIHDYPELVQSGSRFISISGNDIILNDAPDFIRGRGSSSRPVGSFQPHAVERHNHNLPTGAGSISGNVDWGVIDNFWQKTHHYNSWPATGEIANTMDHGSSANGKIEGNFDLETRPNSLTVLLCIYHGVL